MARSHIDTVRKEMDYLTQLYKSKKIDMDTYLKRANQLSAGMASRTKKEMKQTAKPAGRRTAAKPKPAKRVGRHKY